MLRRKNGSSLRICTSQLYRGSCGIRTVQQLMKSSLNVNFEKKKIFTFIWMLYHIMENTEGIRRLFGQPDQVFRLNRYKFILNSK